MMTGIAVSGFSANTVLDLQAVRSAKRHETWRDTVPSVFPGITLERCRKQPSRGSIEHARFAESHAWLIESSPVEVVYHPHSASGNAEYVSVMLQVEGATEVSQGKRRCALQAGNFCFLDNREQFSMVVPDSFSRFLAWQLPRDSVLKSHPLIGRYTAVSFGTDDPGGEMILQNMLHALQASSSLDQRQQSVALSSFIQLFGVLGLPGEVAQRSPHWRLTRALSVIDEGFMDSRLSAQTVADEQNISRRQLDRMFLEETGFTVTARIWERRLACAADMLKDPLHLSRSITEIALLSGFEDAAHFTRAFKKAYGCTPRVWRCKFCVHAAD